MSKVCNKCQTEKPLDQFQKDRSHSDGHSTHCKKCKAKARMNKYYSAEKPPDQEVLDKAVEKADRVLDQIENHAMKLLSDMPMKADVSTLPHISEMFQHLMQLFGGSEGYARHLMAEYLRNKPGSYQRAKMLEMIMRLSQKVSESGAAKVPLELLSEEDLQRELANRLKVIDVDVIEPE